MADLRVTRQAVEAMASDPYQHKLRVTRQAVEVAASDPAPQLKLRVTRQTVEVLAEQADGTFVSAGSTLGISQSALRGLTAGRSASSTLLLADNATGGKLVACSASNNVSLTGAADVSRAILAQASNTLTLGDQAIGATAFGAESSLALLHQATAALTRQVFGQNALTLDHTAHTTTPAVRSASSDLSLTVQATAEIPRYAHSILTLSHMATAAVAHHVSAADALSLDHQAEGSLSKTVSAANDLDLDGEAQGNKIVTRSATTPIYFTETALDPLSFDEIEVEHGIFNRADAYVYVDPEPSGNILSFAQRAGVVHVRADGISVTASSALSLSQWANPTPTGDAVSQLSFGQSASATAGKVATSTLTLGHQASRTIERNVSAGSTLNLYQAVNVVFVKDTTEQDYTPFVGSTEDPDAPTPPSTMVPTLERVEGVQLYWPVDSPTMTVALRGPELDNKDRLSFQRIHRQTRGGTLIVFADPQWPKVQQLILEFVGLKEDEAQALLTFIQATLGKEVGLRDWENRHWIGVILSTQEPIVRNGKHNISTALEFEGAPA